MLIDNKTRWPFRSDYLLLWLPFHDHFVMITCYDYLLCSSCDDNLLATLLLLPCYDYIAMAICNSIFVSGDCYEQLCMPMVCVCNPAYLSFKCPIRKPPPAGLSKPVSSPCSGLITFQSTLRVDNPFTWKKTCFN